MNYPLFFSTAKFQLTNESELGGLGFYKSCIVFSLAVVFSSLACFKLTKSQLVAGFMYILVQKGSIMVPEKTIV